MDDKVKVAEFIPRLEFGGVESMILNYISHLPSKDIFEFHIISQDIYDPNCVQLFTDLGIVVHLVTHKKKNIFKHCIEVWEILKKQQFDVVHSHMTLMNFYVLFMARLLGVGTRISHSHNAFKMSLFKVWFVLPIMRYLNKKAANVWMACGYEAGAFLFGNKEMENQKVIILNNAIDENEFKYNEIKRKKIRSKLGIKNEYVIGHIGRFMEQKNHIYLIDVFARVLQNIPDAKLILIGAGDLYENIKNRSIELGISNSVFFIGNVTNPQDYYQAMDVFILPSLFEGLPVVAIEAQAAGLKCIISDNVDKRCKITPNVEFLSVNKKDYNLWVEHIILSKNGGRDSNAINYIVSKGYSIKIEAKKLENLYLGKVKKVY